MLADVSSNAFYGALNRRFDRRVAFLRQFGFRGLPHFNSGMRRTDPLNPNRQQDVPHAIIMHACNRVWRDTLAWLFYHTPAYRLHRPSIYAIKRRDRLALLAKRPTVEELLSVFM